MSPPLTCSREALIAMTNSQILQMYYPQSYIPTVLTRYCKACHLLLISWHYNLHYDGYGCDDDCCADIITLDEEKALYTRRLLYLSGFLLIASITNAEANCNSTLPSVRTPLAASWTIFLILRYSSF
jgi:hypothetical protein